MEGKLPLPRDSQSSPNQETRAGRVLFVGPDLAEWKNMRDRLLELHPEWLYAWKATGGSAIDFMSANGFPDIVVTTTSPSDIGIGDFVKWVKSARKDPPVYVITYDATHQGHAKESVEAGADAVLGAIGKSGGKELIGMTAWVIRGIDSIFRRASEAVPS